MFPTALKSELREMTVPKWRGGESGVKTLSSPDLTTELPLDSFDAELAELKDPKRGKVIGCLTSTKLIAY